MLPFLNRMLRSTVRHVSFCRSRNSRSMPKCLNSSCWAFSMMARACAFFSTARRCSYHPIASASSMSDAIMRANVRVFSGSSSGGSWYWSNDISLRRLECRFALRPRQPVGHPLRRGLPLEPVTEPLIDAPVIVDLVLLLSQPVILARIHDHHDVLEPGATRVVVELDALVPIDGAVRVAGLEHHGRPDVLHLRHRNVAHV